MKNLLVILLINIVCGCSFNVNDEKAWSAKLCEGYWEQDLQSTRGYIVTKTSSWSNRFQFNIDGKFILYRIENNQPKKDGSGTYKIKKIEGGFENQRQIIVKFNDNYWGYSQFAMSLEDDQKNESFKLTYNLNDKEWVLDHFSQEGKSIDTM